MNPYKLAYANFMQFIITQQSDGRWYGRVPMEYGHDGNLNELDCLQPTPEEALSCLMEQAKEISNEII